MMKTNKIVPDCLEKKEETETETETETSNDEVVENPLMKGNSSCDDVNVEDVDFEDEIIDLITDEEDENVGYCCFCKDICNPNSQACGSCMRSPPSFFPENSPFSPRKRPRMT
jgi:hypothetical protein